MLTQATKLAGLLIALSAHFAFAFCAHADEFPQPYNSEDNADAQPMQPAEAASRFSLPDGFRANVFAAEPDVQNPIASSWDSRGRLWIAENFTYAEPEVRFDLELKDRVIILEDTDRDGKADLRKVFSDQLQMLTSVEVAADGVWLMCPPVLLFVPDRDHDDTPDSEPVVVLDGFDVANENYHNFANGLRMGPDGWLYGRCGGSCPGRVGKPGTELSKRIPIEGGLWRYHPTKQRFEVLTHGTTNPWGHDWNSKGEAFFINTVNGHLWHLIHGAHFVRPFTLDPNSKTYELIDMHADHWHFDTGKKWQDSRDGAANDYGGGHAHSGMMMYLGDNWPEEYRDDLFTLNYHGRRINRENIEREGSGFVAKHDKDLCLSADSFFRGIDLSYGPNGAVYILDWSDTGECHDHTGVHRESGRIFRVIYEPNLVAANPKSLTTLNETELIRLHHEKNHWWISKARQELIARHTRQSLSSDGLSMLCDLARSNEDETLACQAALTLDALDYSSEFFEELLLHESEHVRVLAIRALTEEWPIDDVFSYRDAELDVGLRFENQ